MNQPITHSLSDKDIAMNMIKNSKHNLSAMSMAIMETTNHDLREMMGKHLMSCINEHYALSDLAIAKKWYMAYSPPSEQLQNNLADLQMG